MTIDLSSLPPPDIIETLNFETIFEARKASLINLYPAAEQAAITATLARESSPITRHLQESAYREMVLRARINEGARATMLAFATGADLDQYGAGLDVERLTITPADTESVPPVDAVMESDADFRARILLSIDRYTTAGSREAYRYHTLSADADVLDADPVSPTPQDVLVYVLSRTGSGAASEELLRTVRAALSDELVRPLSDRVSVMSATIFEYEITAKLQISSGPDASTLVASAREAAQAYADATHRMRKRVSLAGLYAALKQVGVVDVVLAAPTANIEMAQGQCAYCTAITLTTEVVDG